MLSQGCIRPSTSVWASPIVLVEKKGGSIWLCVDYRCLNSITVFDAYPIPKIDEIVEKVRNAEYISSIDFSKGYWQIVLKEDTQTCLCNAIWALRIHSHAIWDTNGPSNIC